jgi:excinuclease ABC subunit A
MTNSHSDQHAPASIHVCGARTHNLKAIDVVLPRNQLIVITGLSGSGKSSLAFDTLYAEGQRRYVESLSAYARQFLSVMDKPDVERIDGLSPAIAIEQKSVSHNPRSTVGTVTEIHDYLRLLFARVGIPHCPEHHEPLEARTVSQMVDMILTLSPDERWMLLAPVVSARKGEYRQMLATLQAQGFVRVRIDGQLYDIDNPPTLNPKQKHDIEVVVDRFRIRPDLAPRLADSIETALQLSAGLVRVMPLQGSEQVGLVLSAVFACPFCGYSLTELEPRLFSFNNPAGACPDCDGLGVEVFFDPAKIVAQPELSLAEGAIRGWDRRYPYYFQLLQAVATHYQFDLDTPWQALDDAIQQIVLYGSGDVQLALPTPRDGMISRQRAFEGIARFFERRYRDTDSESQRDELARYISRRPCPGCAGARLNRSARNVFIHGCTLPALASLSVQECLHWFQQCQLSGQRAAIGHKVIIEIVQRLQFLVDVGLDYLTLERSAETLSGGEAQRIRLASQIGAGLMGVMYVLDEPSIGLHQRDNARLLKTLTRLRDLGNTVIVVEHDEEAMRIADHIVDLGPGAGVAGGQIVAQGRADELARHPESLTGRYLSGHCSIPIPTARQPMNPERVLEIHGASGHNLRQMSATFPVGLFCCVTGVSGSGKSTLINDTLYPAAACQLNRAGLHASPYQSLRGLEHFDKVVAIDQRPIGRTPRSNPATYTGLFDTVRDLFAAVPEARARGYGPGRFSFNVRGGRCEACKGDGVLRVAMHFLPDVYVPCEVCHGRRYNRETLEIRYKGHTIDDVLKCTVAEAQALFAPIPVLQRKFATLMAVGLGYLPLGQNATTLSGGEAQRIKLSRELSRRATGRTLYILDEPTTGLHFEDIRHLLAVLMQLRDQGNTVIVIEHNLDVIKSADWILDLGPEGGDKGGLVIASGTPEQVAACSKSYTGQFLKRLFFSHD